MAHPLVPVGGRPFSTTANNNALIDGLLAGYTAAGLRNGFYSYAGGWRDTLGTRRSTLPVWATAGKAPRGSAQSRCATASFSGGPVLLSQWYDDHNDWDLTCPGVSASDPGLFADQGTIGAIAGLWNALGGFGSALGAPTSGELGTADGVGRYTCFLRGSIYWTPAGGAHAVLGAIHGKWADLGFERSALGYATSNEAVVPGGAHSSFQHGWISWSPATGAHEVRGAIAGLWAGLGGERGVLGFPTTDELGTPDGTGRYNHFTGGSVYWTTQTGAQPVRGAIRGAWWAGGAEKGPLGYPTGPEHAVTGGAAQDFQQGTLTWDAVTGTVTATPLPDVSPAVSPAVSPTVSPAVSR